MSARLTLYYYFLILAICRCNGGFSKDERCLTGYMTDVQTWVDEKGVLTLTDDYDHAIDLSANANPEQVLQLKLSNPKTLPVADVLYLSLARCRLTRVPMVFLNSDSAGRSISETLQFVTFYGNDFSEISPPGETYRTEMNATDARIIPINMALQGKGNQFSWSSGLRQAMFSSLKELDLRACSIQSLIDNIFEHMPKLQALYIGENKIVYISPNAFAGLSNLIHLDMSRNEVFDDKGDIRRIQMENNFIFEPLKNLSSLDLSFTRLIPRYTRLFESIGRNLSRLSVCETGLRGFSNRTFPEKSLRILDVSGNSDIFASDTTLSGIKSTLQIVYAKEVGLTTLNVFKGCRNLKILDASKNKLREVDPEIAQTMPMLQALDLDKNRITAWFSPVFSLLPSLKLLSLRDNNINMISEEMILDIANVRYVGIARNFIVCSCRVRDFFDLALKNEEKYKKDFFIGDDQIITDPFIDYHRGFKDFNVRIKHRPKVYSNSSDSDYNEDMFGRFLIFDYHQLSYMCLVVPESRSVEFSSVYGCHRNARDIDFESAMERNTRMLYVLLLIPALLLLLGLAYRFRKNFRYCLITMRNSTMLSLVHKNEFVDDDKIYHYDVFVSYCNEDRQWVLDHLLTHLEAECSVSACLHERDFQVGHSILVNIVSCMDRSRYILLVISRRFLLSQWCQFEMHLAQHRLLETRREDLILVFLEEIPRRLRPNTLQYLMLTKTYIVWGRDQTEQALFWKRLKKTLVSLKLREAPIASASLA